MKLTQKVVNQGMRGRVWRKVASIHKCICLHTDDDHVTWKLVITCSLHPLDVYQSELSRLYMSTYGVFESIRKEI